MSVNLVLLPLSAWGSSHLTSILESKTQDKFDVAFDATFSVNCSFAVNGKVISRDEYKTQLLEQSAAGFGENSTAVNIEGQTQVEVGNQGQLSGLVGMFYTALSESRFLVLGFPAETRAASSLNLTIEPTEKNPQNPNLPIRGFFDPRRVTSVNQVVAETVYHVTIPRASVPKAATPQKSPTKVELGPGLQLPPSYLNPFGESGPAIPPSETGTTPETLPGNGEFGAGPVVIPGESVGRTNV